MTTASTIWGVVREVMANSCVVPMQRRKGVKEGLALLRAVPGGELLELLGDEGGAAGQEGVDVLLAVPDGQGDVDTRCRGAFGQPGGVVEERLDAAGRDVQPWETGEVGVQRVRQRSLRVD